METDNDQKQLRYAVVLNRQVWLSLYKTQALGQNIMESVTFILQ